MRLEAAWQGRRLLVKTHVLVGGRKASRSLKEHGSTRPRRQRVGRVPHHIRTVARFGALRAHARCTALEHLLRVVRGEDGKDVGVRLEHFFEPVEPTFEFAT